MAHPSGIAQIALRGTLIAVAVAALLGVVVFGAVMLMGGDAGDAMVAVVYVALSYLALNLVILGVGLFFRPSRSWAVGAALATPVIVSAIGFGYVAFRSVPT